MEEQNLLFDWDPIKAHSNLRKHKVAFEEAKSVFGDLLASIIDDPDHSMPEEERFVILGQSDKNRILVIIFTDRNLDANTIVVKIISVRLADRLERKNYEEGT